MNKTKKTALFLLISFFIFNLTDAIITYYVVGVFKMARELNPIMKFFLELGPIYFFSIKILIGSLICLIVWRTVLREKKVIYFLWICATLYFINFLYQIIVGAIHFLF